MTTVADASVHAAAPVDVGKEGRWAGTILARGSFAATSANRVVSRLDIELFPNRPFAKRMGALRTSLAGFAARYVALAEALDAQGPS